MTDFVASRRAEVSGSQRLDGLLTGLTEHRPVARFDHLGHVWGVDGDTHFEPLDIAFRAIAADPADEPFVIRATATRFKLVLRDDLEQLRHDRGARNAAYLYVYATRQR